MSLLRWIGEEETAAGEELPPLPKVYRLNEPETSAEEPSADFSAFSDFADEPEDDGWDDLPPPPVKSGAGRIAFAPQTEEIPACGVVLSDVRPTKKGRMALFWQDAAGQEQFLFSVDGETCALRRLVPGVRLSAAEVESVRGQSDLRRAKDKALQYLAAREHASGELYRKLSEKFDEPTAAAAVAEMCRLALLDDAAFAVHRAAHLARKGKSRREIAALLAGLGISREDREAALEQLPEDEETTLRTLIEKQYRSKLAAGKKDAVAAALLRRGYSGALVRRVLTEYENEDQTE